MSVRKTVQFNRTRCLAAALAASCALSGSSLAQDTSEKIGTTKMGAYSFAGKIISNSAGRSLHCDHGYAQFQIPEKPRRLPIVFWHSASAIHWESTPDGREGFQSMFLRRGYPIYLIDVPRLGRAGNGCEEFTYKPALGADQAGFASRRIGSWNPPSAPEFNPGVQVPTTDPVWVDQVSRARYPEFGGNEAADREAGAVKVLLQKIGGGILVSHSGSGLPSFATAAKSTDVKAIISYEPSAFVFPKGQLPTPITNAADGAIISPGFEVSPEEFKNLLNIPLQLIYGDYIPEAPDASTAQPERRRITRAYAQSFVDLINSRGGNAQLVNLPKIGIKGNTHLLMTDLNNVQLADQLAMFLKEKGLDARP